MINGSKGGGLASLVLANRVVGASHRGHKVEQPPQAANPPYTPVPVRRQLYQSHNPVGPAEHCPTYNPYVPFIQISHKPPAFNSPSRTGTLRPAAADRGHRQRNSGKQPMPA